MARPSRSSRRSAILRRNHLSQSAAQSAYGAEIGANSRNLRVTGTNNQPVSSLSEADTRQFSFPKREGERRRFPMNAQGFRAQAQRCRDLSLIAARPEVREQLREWVDDFEAEAEAAEEGPKLLRTAAEEMRSLAERDSLELRRMAADLESAADKILERAV